jgi:chaperonin GroES
MRRTMKMLPEPKGWRILIKIEKAKEVSEGGIILSDVSKDAENYLSITGTVVKIGPMCWHDRDTGQPWQGGPWCKVGDKIIVPKFTHFRMEIEDTEYRIINDDEVIAVVDPNLEIKVYS